MIKESSTNLPLSPEEQQEAADLLGRGLFSAIQLAKHQEMQAKLNKKKYEDAESNVLKIPLPIELMPQFKKAEAVPDTIFSRALKMQNHPVKFLLTSQQGFGDARREYYDLEKARIQKELEDAQRDYIDTLSQIKTGAEQRQIDTPCVDAFCNGMAYQALFDKEASSPDDIDIEDDAIQRLLSQAGNAIKAPFRPAIDTAASGLLGTGAGSAYLTYMLRKKMRDSKDLPEEQLPTRVELEPYV